MNRRIMALAAAVALLGSALAVPTLAQDKMSATKPGKMTKTTKMAKPGKMTKMTKMAKPGKMTKTTKPKKATKMEGKM